MNISRRSWQFLFLAVTFVCVLYLGYRLQTVLTPILLALVGAYILNPVVALFQRWGMNRFYSVLMVFVMVLILLISMLILIIPVVTGQVSSAYQSIVSVDYQQTAEVVMEWTGKQIEAWNERFPTAAVDEAEMKRRGREFLQDNLKGIAEAIKNTGLGMIDVVGGGFSVLVTVLSYGLLLPIYMFFFMLRLDQLWTSGQQYLPDRSKDEILRVLGKIHESISGFFRGQLMVCLVKGIIIAIGLSIIGVKFSILLGVFAFFASFVPFLILILSFLPSLAVLILTQGFSWGGVLAVSGLFAATDLLEGLVLYPVIVGKKAGVHPLLVVVSLLVGGELFGFFGVVLSVPLGSAGVIFTREVILPQLKDFTDSVEEKENKGGGKEENIESSEEPHKHHGGA